jgi:hypothetical protein
MKYKMLQTYPNSIFIVYLISCGKDEPFDESLLLEGASVFFVKHKSR